MDFKQAKERIENLEWKLKEVRKMFNTDNRRAEFYLDYYYTDDARLLVKNLPASVIEEILAKQEPIWAEELFKLKEAIKAAEIVVEGYTKS